jgi:hypothetical protein
MKRTKKNKRKVVATAKNSKPSAKLVSVNAKQDEIYGFLAGEGKILGDVISPALSPEEWGELK